MRRPTTARALAQRARVILGCAAGKSNTVVARELRVTKQTVGEWGARFLRQRLDGLRDDPRPGAPRRIGDAEVERVMRLYAGHHPARRPALEYPRDGAPVWAEPNGGQSDLAGFRLAAAPQRDVQAVEGPAVHRESTRCCGLYLNPSDEALVLCVDEKAQIQLLDRTQPRLPMRPGQVERRTRDYSRHGTTSLCAALTVRTVTVIGEFHRRHRAKEFRTFLATVVKS